MSPEMKADEQSQEAETRSGSPPLQQSFMEAAAARLSEVVAQATPRSKAGPLDVIHSVRASESHIPDDDGESKPQVLVSYC